MSSIDVLPSTVGPSVSICETAIPRKKVDFTISHYVEEPNNDSPQKDIQTKGLPTTQIEDEINVTPRSTTATASQVDSSQTRD